MAQKPQSRAVPATEAAPPPMDRLAENLVNLMRDGFAREIEDKRDAWAWRMLARDIDAHLARRWQTMMATQASKGDLNALVQGWNVEMILTFTDAIGKASTMSVGKAKYAETVGNLSDSCNAWGQLYGTAHAGYWQHIALLWLSLWHGAAAGMKANKARSLVIESQGGLLGDGALAVLNKGLAAIQSVGGTIADNRTAQAGARAREVIARTVKDMDAAVQQVRDVAARAANSSAPAREQVSRHDRQALPLDGQRMTTSVVGTWLLLVMFSWIALIWGALISIPFGVGIAIFIGMGAGIIGVPLWGTVFGFFGMNVARDSTLHRMGFTDVPDGHALRETTARYARALDLPMPRIGVIDAHNAFAMGTDHHHATVAIGRPLLKTLTPDEVAAVIGHELGHVVSGDMRRMMLMRTFQNATVWFMMFQGFKQLARWIICWAAELYILAFSRHREYYADAVGAALAGKDAMIGALRKLESAPALTGTERAQARFMFRGNPLSTHPSMAQRIAALQAETYLKRLPLKRSAD
jgi:heat shock protein HtpX